MFVFRTFLISLLFVGIFVGPYGGNVEDGWSYRHADAATDRVCKRYFQKKQYERSADCFQRLVLSVDPKASEEDRIKAGVWLRNAVVALKRAANQEKKIGKANYLREKGVKLLDSYIDKKLYVNSSQRNIAKTMKTGLVDSIGYTNLTVVSGHLKAKIQVIGFQWKSEGVGTLNQKLRPGTYTVLVTYPGTPASAKAVNMEASVPKVITFQPPAKKRTVAKTPERREPPVRRPAPPKSSPVPLIVMSVGAVVTLGGAGVVGWSVVGTQGERDALLNEQPSPENTKQIGQLTELAKTQNLIGWVVLGVGVGGVVAGVVMLAMQPKAPSTTPTSTRLDLTLQLSTSRALGSFQ
ncbi:MAG: hypothetical protein CL920_06625 [Deltaproteobacteria bacterium]|nr:hypothetical protein [Deltaproteobacteria bacterium]MBU48356.1 hypothetical protein [Deltaproteobacteria bacterium]|tara:strand:+ start:29130 stop:30182 length:1053 start_codon:yes stop_codon:yes gene_type:complete